MSSNVLEEGKIVPLIYDKMFKKVFGNSNNTEPIKHLISIILKEKIDSVSLLPQEFIGDNNKVKKNCIDVLVRIKEDQEKHQLKMEKDKKELQKKDEKN